MLLRAVVGVSEWASRRDERGRGPGEVSPDAVPIRDEGSSIAAAASGESEGKRRMRFARLLGRETHSLRMCSSMHLAQKRCRHGDTTFTFFIVPQHTAHRVSWRTGPSFIVAAGRDAQ